MGKSLALRIFIKSAVDQKNLKLGMVIAWNIGIVSKKSVAIATCLEKFSVLAPIAQIVSTILLQGFGAVGGCAPSHVNCGSFNIHILGL